MDRLNQFSRENDFLCLLSRTWIKRHFPFKGPFTYLLEIRVKITSWNVYVINSWKYRYHQQRVYIWSKTFWKIIDVNQKRRGPKLSPEKQALIIAYSDDWPLIRTLWYLSLKKLSIRFQIAWNTHSSLYSKPLCQALSKAFEISKNTALVSRVGLQSNVEKIWVISINWLKIDWPKSNSLCQA